ncbi:MAG TPA: tetratricopeptide repeat protein [Anaerolineales bacterium]|nr:tetratricopeptide repeat protein [Anaerolineales bacterium]
MNLPEYSFGTWVRRRRKGLDLTQQELAQRVGCSLSLIFKIESDERRPSRQVAELLAEHLEVPLDQRSLFLKVARQEKSVDQLEVVPSHAEFGPASSPDTAKPNLPLPLTPIIGREFELAEITRLMQDPQCRLLTLTGPGGIGKTRLSLEAAQHLQGIFADGVFFVALAGIGSPDYVVPAIAEAMSFNFSGSSQLRMQLFNFLLQKRLLLILDNMEHVIEGADVAREILQHTDKVKLLATSREPLHLQAEWTFHVQGLPVPQGDRMEELEGNSASRLFLQRAEQAQAGFTISDAERPAVLRICRLLEGLPLGIELAAAWVRTLSCREIAEELKRSLDFLASSARDIPQRHRSITAVFDHSWALLSVHDQEIMRRLSVFRGGFTRQAAEQAAGATLSTLASLIDKSLIRHSASKRYDLHELTRQYAQERLTRSGELEHARNRHLEFFMALAEEAKEKFSGPEQILWLDRLEEDNDNLRAALEWSLRDEETKTKLSEDQRAQTAQDALRLAGLLYQFWKRRSHWAEGREWLRRALAQAAGLPGTRERRHALDAAALLAVEQADTRSARQLAEENLRLAQELGDKHSIAAAFNTLGLVYWKQKDHAGARSLCEQGLALFRELGDRVAVADTLHSLGHITINQGDLEAAQSYLEESLWIAQERGNKIGFVEALGDLGLVAYLQGDYPTAHSRLEDSLLRFREANLLPGAVSALNRLGDLARCQGDYEKADRLYTEGLSLYREMGDLDEIPSMLHNLGYTAQQRGDYAEAMALFKEGLSIQYKMGNRAGIAECLMGIASVLSAQGKAEAAARLLGAAEAMRESAGASLWPANRVEYDRILTSLKSALDEPAFAAAWSAGQALNTEQAIAEVPGTATNA